MTRIRIGPDGTIRGLWTDEIDWTSLGKTAVRRASHVEFCEHRQFWYVCSSQPRAALRASLKTWLKPHVRDVLHWSSTRSEALAWEHDHFSPGGPGWPFSPASQSQAYAGDHTSKKEGRLVGLLRFLFALLSGDCGGRQHVSDHQRSQAYGPRWSHHRPRHINGYSRRSPHGKRR